MTVLPPTTIDLIADRIKMLGTVTLSAEVCHELLHRAAQSYRMELVLAQMAKESASKTDCSKWARRVIEDEKRDRPKLKYPSRLVKIEVA
jgi:hypothetical protein